ncbi:MAG: glycosyltransferase family 4 protein [Planctomycetes bacterium]|nr:glycosyltransferase family 4 protein [Planctomycetota bacterium]
MRICHVITRLIVGGAQENTILSCEGLCARGHEVILVSGPTVGPEGRLVGRARGGGYRYVELPPLVRQISPGEDLAAYRALARLIGELRPDIIHTHSSKAGILGRQAAHDVRSRPGGPRVRIVHTIHGLAFHPYQNPLANFLFTALERRAARQSDAIISVADAMTNQALAAGVGQRRQYTTIYSGMEVEPYMIRPAGADRFRESLNLPADAILIAQVSRLAELKGHDFILEAARRIADRRVHFCFVGDGWLAGQIKAAIARSDLSDRFHLTGLLAPDLIPAVMHASDIVIHCSLREGLARAIPQAMLAARPVVSFDVDGAREVIDETTGVLLAPRDVAGLAAAIEKLTASPQLRQQLGAAGREKCRTIFDWRVMVERIERLYESLFNNR